jgi:hypothetical protein
MEYIKNRTYLSIPEMLNDLDRESLYLAFQEFLNNPLKLQKEVLIDILNFAKDSEFGKTYSFESINSIEKYQNIVPISEYSDYTSFIEEMKLGKEDILFNGNTDSFIVSSGTTGKMKYFPESKRGVLSKNLVMNLRSTQLAILAPEFLKGQSNILGIINSSNYGSTEGGIPIMSASGQGASNYNTRDENKGEDIDLKMVLPDELLNASNISHDDKDYLMALFALSDENLTAVICNNLAHFNFLLKQIQDNTFKMINDLEYKQLSVDIDEKLKEILLDKLPKNKERVNELKKIYNNKKTLPIRDIWPNFKTVGCWLSSSVGRAAFDIKRELPKDINYLEWGYGASEGKFNVPFKMNVSSGPVAPFACFFEFLPIDGENPLTLNEVKEDQFYELIITTYSGLYRYNLHDLISIKEKTLKTPNIEFECKYSENAICKNNKIYASNFTNVLKKTEDDTNEFISFFQVFIENDKVNYILQPKNEDFNKIQFKKILEKHLIKDLDIVLDKIYIMSKDYRDSLFKKEISPGKTITSTKLPTLVNREPKMNEFIKEIIFE